MKIQAPLMQAIKVAQREVLAKPSSGNTGARTVSLNMPGGMAVMLSLNK